MKPILLSRDAFREAVFARDRHRCVTCGDPAQDAHHIMERRLWPDGGYYLDNGAALCGPCHIRAEQTVITCEAVRTGAGITKVLLPPHLYPDERYDKWGNPYLPNGQRVQGELYGDSSVQKILAQGHQIREFTPYVKYPRTLHLPWSPGATKDDVFRGEWKTYTDAVVTEKMDGENTTMYRGHIHARSVTSGSHETRTWVKALHARIEYDIPPGWRICGENLYAKHSIPYDNLMSYFLVFSIWTERNTCLPWDETLEWCELLGLNTVPVLYRGFGSEEVLRAIHIDPERQEGYVVRPAQGFQSHMFQQYVAKYVRAEHVQTHGGWMRQVPERNGLVTL